MRNLPKRPTSTKPSKNQCETHFGASAHRSKFEAKSICQRFRFRLVTRTPSRASWKLSLRLLERLWSCPGTHVDSSWPLFIHPSVPRSALGRHLGVQKQFRTRPEASTKRFWTPRTAQDRLFVDFGTTWHGFPAISDQIFIDFRSNRLRRSHRIGGSKKSRVTLAARLSICCVQSLRAARVSFEMAFEQRMFSFFSLRTHKPT